MKVSAPLRRLADFLQKTSSRSTQGVDTSVKPATFTGELPSLEFDRGPVAGAA